MVWSLPGLVTGVTGDLASAGGASLARGEFVLWNLAIWWPWVVFTPIVLSLVGRIASHGDGGSHGNDGSHGNGGGSSEGGGTWWLRLPVHALGWAIIALVHTALAASLAARLVPGLHGDAPFMTIADHLLSTILPGDLLAYAAVTGFALASEYRRRWQTGQDEAQALEAKLSKAQLEALKMQLHPHFLFNSLHALGVLVRKRDTRGALRMLIGLSDLLRITLDNAGKQVVPLRQELSFLDRYLRVEQVRFGDLLEIERVIDQSVLDAIVPSLALQPLLENAIRHGIAPRDAPGSIRLTARRTENGRLRLEVADNGVGLAEDSAEISGMGLANVRARLDQLYGSRHRFEISDREDRPGVVAAIEIPLNFELENSTHDG